MGRLRRALHFLRRIFPFRVADVDRPFHRETRLCGPDPVIKVACLECGLQAWVLESGREALLERWHREHDAKGGFFKGR